MRFPISERTPREKAISVAIESYSRLSGCAMIENKMNQGGINIPPAAARIGRIAFFKEESSQKKVPFYFKTDE
jgi:hypothetical protein